MAREYRAAFLIDCGVSSGFGVKYPDKIERIERVTAESPNVAYQSAMDMAGKFADDYLSNPDTGLTTVRLLSLRDDDVLSGGDVSFDASKSVVKRSMLEHLFALVSGGK